MGRRKVITVNLSRELIRILDKANIQGAEEIPKRRRGASRSYKIELLLRHALKPYLDIENTE